MNKKIIVYIVVALIAVVGLIILFSQKSAAPASPGTSGTGLGADIYNQVSQNPAEKLPETNPFSKPTDPFKAVQKTNPFE